MNRSNAPTPIETSATAANNEMPTSAMRQGRFLSPENNNSSATAEPQITSPSQVTFQPGAVPPSQQPPSSTPVVDMSSNFMFDDMEDFQHYLQQPPHDSTPTNNPNANTNTATPPPIPTEAQLTLLCLDYLRSLRRSYHQNPQDLLNGEGLHADYLSLAIWSLNRAFCGAHTKLGFGPVKVGKIEEEDDEDRSNKKGGEWEEE